jgi:hypothetical protein
MNRHQRRALKGKIDCATHGKIKWEKHICCSKCKAVYDARSPGSAPIYCTCGARLFPENPKDDVSTFTGRSICPKCYMKRKAEQP